jgi:hypothetical protein
MASSGALTLQDYPGDIVVVACPKSGRHGEYRKARLVAEHGADIRLPDLRAVLARDCALVGKVVGNETCGAIYPELAARARFS